jgi:ribosomal-protein-alanine N-acetyltransferase
MVEFQSDRLDFSPLVSEMVTQRYPDALNNPEINQYLETRHEQQDIDSCRRYIAECNSDDSSRLFGVFLRSDGSHIGNVRIGHINWLYKTAEISLVVLEQSCSGQGLGFEMVHAATNYAFRVLKLEKIEAGCMAANKASLRVFEKAGYKKEGLIRESIVLNGERVDYFLLGVLNSELVQ